GWTGGGRGNRSEPWTLDPAASSEDVAASSRGSRCPAWSLCTLALEQAAQPLQPAGASRGLLRPDQFSARTHFPHLHPCPGTTPQCRQAELPVGSHDQLPAAQSAG